MNISSEIFPTDELNSSDHFFYNNTGFPVTSLVNLFILLFGFPINSYVIWLIVTGTGNGLASEFFTLNLCICEMIFYVQCLFNLISDYVKDLSTVSTFVDGLSITGRPLFQCLICVERYLAVVHPVIFLKFKPLRYRLICCAFAWVAGFVSGGIAFVSFFVYLNLSYYILVSVYLFLLSLIQLFCLVVVLIVLKRSGPGERGRNENQMKRRAFYLILTTNVTTLCLFLTPYILLLMFPGLTLLIVFYICFALAGAVQPLLFLYRVEKPPFFKSQ